MQCVAFQDAALDILMNELVCPDYDVADIFSHFLEVFEDGSAGRQYAVDFFVYGMTSLRPSTYEGLELIDDPDFVGAVAREICKYQKIDVSPEWLESQENSMMIVMGYLGMREYDDKFGKGNRDWDADRCKYHRHTELGLPCYALLYGEAVKF